MDRSFKYPHFSRHVICIQSFKLTSATARPFNHDHSIPITDGRYPIPQFAFVANHREIKYKLKGYEVGYNGYGTGPAFAKISKHYEFTPQAGKAVPFDLLEAN